MSHDPLTSSKHSFDLAANESNSLQLSAVNWIIKKILLTFKFIVFSDVQQIIYFISVIFMNIYNYTICS